jgi:hypothetical protein
VATTLNNLGAVQSDLGQLRDAEASYTEALGAYRGLEGDNPGVFLVDLATTLNNLGTLQRDLRQLRDTEASFAEALKYLNRELEVRKEPYATADRRQMSWSNLGRLYLMEEPELNWPDRHQARNAFRHARECAELIRGQFLRPDDRRRTHEEAMHVYESLVRLNVEISETDRTTDAFTEAVEVAEASRTRNLIEMLAEETLQPRNLPQGSDLGQRFWDLRRCLRTAREQLSAEERQARKQADSAVKERVEAVQRDLAGMEHSLREYLEQIRRHDLEYDPDKPVQAIDFPTIQRLLPTDTPTAVVHYSLTLEYGVALIITRDRVEAVRLPELNANQAIELARAWYRAYYDKNRNWDSAIPPLLEPVATRAVRPVVEALAGRDIRRLLLCPNRALHIFPLHACMIDGQYLADRFDEVVYTPSLSILHRCVSRDRPPEQHLLLINVTGSSALSHLG